MFYRQVLLQPSSTSSTTVANSQIAVVCHTRTQFGRRAFSVCGPDIWNSVLTNLRFTDSHFAFWRALKTHLLTLLSVISSTDLYNAHSIYFMYDWSLELSLYVGRPTDFGE